MYRPVGTIHAVVAATVMVPIFLLTLIVILGVVGPIFQAVTATGPSGVTKSVIQFGNAHKLFFVGGLLSIPIGIFLLLMVGGRSGSRRFRPPRRRP